MLSESPPCCLTAFLYFLNFAGVTERTVIAKGPPFQFFYEKRGHELRGEASCLLMVSTTFLFRKKDGIEAETIVNSESNLMALKQDTDSDLDVWE
jgi:hypothetical protein